MSEFEPFEPSRHANSTFAYQQSHVVTEHLPLAAIVFPPAADELAELVGYRDASVCPKLGNLTASPFEEPPVIHGIETKQRLTVQCSANREVRLGQAAYSICSLRAKQAGLDPKTLPEELVTDNAKRSRIWCPFLSLGGAVISQTADVIVDVTVTAHDVDRSSVIHLS
jgi:hypothetical protein